MTSPQETWIFNSEFDPRLRKITENTIDFNLKH